MLCGLTEHIITEVVAEVTVLFAVPSMCVCREGQEEGSPPTPALWLHKG